MYKMVQVRLNSGYSHYWSFRNVNYANLNFIKGIVSPDNTPENRMLGVKGSVLRKIMVSQK
jgi:hypothetical protein